MSEHTNTIKVKDIITTYHGYDDQHLSFTFSREDKEGIYYAHWIDFSDSGSLYWVNVITLQEEVGLLNKEFDIRTLMTSKEEVEIVKGSGEITSYALEDALAKYSDCLPDEGIYLID